MGYYFVILSCSLLLFSSCKHDYSPTVLQVNSGILVVDGFVNSGKDTSFIRLSRTNRLEDGVRNAAEQNAMIDLLDGNGMTLYSFQALNTDGMYYISNVSLDYKKLYKLRIVTNGEEYITDEMPVIKTPDIDSVSWIKQNEGVRFFVTTHDSQNKTSYYRWEYTETWEYHSDYYSAVKYENEQLISRNLPDEQVQKCWSTRHSTNILLGSTVRLSENIISLLPLHFIPTNSEEIGRRYSILVKQYGLTKENFDYLYNLREITERTGSFFDAQPSQLIGNVHNLTNQSKPVIGYMSITTATEKRIFVDAVQVLPWNFRFYCADPIGVPADSFEYFFGEYGEYSPIMATYNPSGNVIGALAGTAICVDCTERGGTNKKPDFW